MFILLSIYLILTINCGISRYHGLEQESRWNSTTAGCRTRSSTYCECCQNWYICFSSSLNAYMLVDSVTISILCFMHIKEVFHLFNCFWPFHRHVLISIHYVKRMWYQVCAVWDVVLYFPNSKILMECF